MMTSSLIKREVGLRGFKPSRSGSVRSISELLLSILLVAYAAGAIAASAAPEISYGSVFKLIAGPFILLSFLTYRPQVRTRANVALLCLFLILLISAASYYWSIVPSLSVSKSLVFLNVFLGSLAVHFSLKTLGFRGISLVARGLMIGGAISALLVFWGAAHGTYVTAAAFDQTQERITAGNANPNWTAISLAMVAPIFWFVGRGIVKWSVLPLGVAVALTGSRTGLISLLVVSVGLLAVPFLRGNSDQTQKRKNLQLVIQWVGVLVVTVFAALHFLPQSDYQRFAALSSEFSGGTFTHRTTLWGAAWQGFLARPLSGFGSGSAPTYELLTTGRFLVTHQTLLQFLLEIGVFGAFAFLVAYFNAIWGSIRHLGTCPWLLLTMLGMTSGMAAAAWDYNKLTWLILVVGGFLASTRLRANQGET